MHPATNSYQAQSVATAGPAQLVTMLYDRVLVATGRVRQAEAGAVETVHVELQRAQDILVELQLALDHEQGGQIAQNLYALYDFCLDRLRTANLQKDPSQLDAVDDVIRGLRDAWDQVATRAPVAV